MRHVNSAWPLALAYSAYATGRPCLKWRFCQICLTFGDNFVSNLVLGFHWLLLFLHQANDILDTLETLYKCIKRFSSWELLATTMQAFHVLPSFLGFSILTSHLYINTHIWVLTLFFSALSLTISLLLTRFFRPSSSHPHTADNHNLHLYAST